MSIEARGQINARNGIARSNIYKGERQAQRRSENCAHSEILPAEKLSKPDWIRVKAASPSTRIETLVHDFRGRKKKALDILCSSPPNVMNHNIETVPRL